jgi:transcriptional regulator with XRE-family HTH domain
LLIARVQKRKKIEMIQVLSVRYALVGTLLRQYREAQGLHLQDAACILECDRSKISRIETGQRGIRPKELRELLGEYGVAGDVQDVLAELCRPRRSSALWLDYRRTLPGPYLDFITAEGVASRVLVHAPLRVPEVLCTEPYARALAAADPGVPPGTREARVQAIITHRQPVMFSRKPRVTVILAESALRQQAADEAVMRGQYRHLTALAGAHAWLDIRLLPFSAGTAAGGDAGAFSLLRFSEIPELGLAHVPGPGGGICLDDRALIASYARTFDRLAGYAATREQTLATLRELAGR